MAFFDEVVIQRANNVVFRISPYKQPFAYLIGCVVRIGRHDMGLHNREIGSDTGWILKLEFERSPAR
jgi:hypothetical protein